MAAAILIVLPIGAVGALIATVDPNDYKPEIAAVVQEATGRALSLDGPVRITRSLWPTIEIRDVKLANLPGGTRPDMGRAERITAQVSLLPLLWGRIEFVELTLIGPNILFEQVGGKPNWVFTSDAAQSRDAAPAKSTAEAQAPSTRLGPSITLRFRSVHVQNGMMTLRTPARTQVAGIRSFDLQHPREDAPLRLFAVLVYSDNQPFSVRASARPTAGVFDPWNTEVNFAAFDATASAKGMMKLAGDYDMQIEANAPALEKLNALLPEMQLPALRKVLLSTHLTNGPALGSLPVIGATKLHFDGVDLGDRLPGLKLGATDVSLPEAGRRATLSTTGSLAGQAVTLGGTFGVPEQMDGPVKLPVDLTAQTQAAANGGKAPGGTTSNLGIKGDLALSTARFDGLDVTVAGRAPALAALHPTLPRALPPLTDVSLAGRLLVPADLASLTLRGVKLSARQGDLAGDMTINLQSNMGLDAKLHSNRLDLDALMPSSGTTTAARHATATPPSTKVISDAALPWDVLRGPPMNLTLDVAAPTFLHKVWPKTEIELQIKQGGMRPGRLQMALPGGPLRMSLTIDASTDNVPVSLTVQAPAVPLATIGRLAGLPGEATGTVQLGTELRAVGRSAGDLAGSLDGTFAATMTGGSLSNAALIELASAPLKALGITVPPQGVTAIRCFGLVGAFSKGVGRFRTIALNTTYLKLDGVGQVDLGAETVALKMRPMAEVSGSKVSVPVLVEGPFRDVKGRLDADGLDKLGLLIDAWFGGDRPQMCADAGLEPPQARQR